MAKTNNVKNDPFLMYKGEEGEDWDERKRPYLSQFDDEGFRWLRKQYKEEHGSLAGFEAYCREYGIVSAHAARRILDTEATISDIEHAAVGHHCRECAEKAAVAAQADE